VPENYYDEASRQWVTSESRYAAIASQPQYARLGQLIYSEPEHAWPLLLELVAAMPDDLLGFAGAGPVETFIWRNGAAFIGRIEAETKKNPRFRDAAFEINFARGERFRGAILVSFRRLAGMSPAEGTPVEWLLALPAPLITIRCSCEPEVAAERFRQRMRHPGHLDGATPHEELMVRFRALAITRPPNSCS
jgi:hypothetical protein